MNDLPAGWLRRCDVTRAFEPDDDPATTPPAPGASPPPEPSSEVDVLTGPWPEGALHATDRPRLDERALRLGGFNPSVAVELSDGQKWWLPPIDESAFRALPDLLDLVEAIPDLGDIPDRSDALAVGEFFDRSDWSTTVTRRIAGRLLTLNYRLPPHTIRGLLSGMTLPFFEVENAVAGLLEDLDESAPSTYTD